jgi:hypothetical protein
VLLLQSAYPPPRYGIRETASGAKWAGYREVLGRCLTQALLEHTCWLLHLAVGQIPNGPFIPPSATPRDQNNNVLPLYSRCGAMHAAPMRVSSWCVLCSRYMCLRLWPTQDDPGDHAPAPRQLLPPDHGALLRNHACHGSLMCLCCPAAPWLLNVPVAHAELAARGPHAVVGQAGSIMGRAACTKCRGMNPLLGARTALFTTWCCAHARPVLQACRTVSPQRWTHASRTTTQTMRAESASLLQHAVVRCALTQRTRILESECGVFRTGALARHLCRWRCSGTSRRVQ